MTGGHAKASHRLRAGARVTRRGPAARAPRAHARAPSRSPSSTRTPTSWCVNKPVGLVVHPGAGHRTGTLVHALLAHCGPGLSGHRRRAAARHRPPAGPGHLRAPRGRQERSRAPGARPPAQGADRRAALPGAGSRPAAARGGRGRDRDRPRSARPAPDGGAAGRGGPAGAHPLPGRRAVRAPGPADAGRGHPRDGAHPPDPRAPRPSGGSPSSATGPIGGAGRRRSTPSFAAHVAGLGGQALHAAVLGFTHPTTGASHRFEAPPAAGVRRAPAWLRGLPRTAGPRTRVR